MFAFRQAIFCFVRYAQNRFCIFYGIIHAFFSSRCSVTHPSSPAIVSCPISDRCAGSRSAIQRDASLGGSCATRVCLCAVNSSCPLRHSLGGSARTGGSNSVSMRVALSRAFADIYGALRCRGHSLIWRVALSRTFADMARYVAPHVAVIRRGIDGRTSVY